MSRLFTKTAGIVSSVALVASLTACANDDVELTADDGPVVIDFWHASSGPSSVYLDQKIKEFNEAHQGDIIVNASFQGDYEDNFAKLAASIQTGDVPTLMQASDIQTSYMRDSGIAYPMEDALDDVDSYKDRLLPLVRNYYELDDTLWSMPMFVSRPVLYVNPEILDEAGVNIDDLESFDGMLDAVDKIYENTDTPGLAIPISAWWVEQMAASLGEHWCTPDNGVGAERATKVSATDPDLLELWNRLGEMYQKGSIANLGESGDQVISVFGQDRVGMVFGSSGGMSNLEDMGKDFVALPLPVVNDEAGSAPGGNSLWILKEGKSQDEIEAAAEFAEFVATPEFQSDVLSETGYIPTTQGAADNAKQSATDNQERMLVQQEESPANSVTAGCHMGALNEVRNHVTVAMQNIASGEGTPEEEWNIVNERAANAIERYETRVEATQNND